MNDVEEQQRRELIAACQRALEQAAQGEATTREIAEALRLALDAGATGADEPRAVALAACVRRAFEDLKARWEDPPLGVDALRTGLDPIDHTFGGLERGSLLVISGSEQSGRTALALRLADGIARNGLPSLFLSHREPVQALALRLMFGDAGLGDDETFGARVWDDFVRSSGELSEIPLWLVGVDRAARAPLHGLLEALDDRREPRDSPPALLIVDDVDEAPEGTFAALRTLKRWARRHGAAVVAVTRRTESLYAHGPLEPDAALRLSRPEPGVIAVCGIDGGRHRALRARLVFSEARGWIDFVASNVAYEEEQEAW
jgi:hypothetical protein